MGIEGESKSQHLWKWHLFGNLKSEPRAASSGIHVLDVKVWGREPAMVHEAFHPHPVSKDQRAHVGSSHKPGTSLHPSGPAGREMEAPFT